MPETFDLDRALDDLARDVATRSRPAGADRAVTTARRRRTSLGAVAAVAVLSVGGLVLSQLGGGSPAPQPGGPPGNVTVAPEPTRPTGPGTLDADVLNEAFDGWGEWTQNGGSGAPNPYCLGLTPQDPLSGSSNYFGGGPGEPSRPVAADVAGRVALRRDRSRLRAPVDLPQVIWLVRVDDRVGTFTVAGAQDTPPDDVVPAVAAAMAADDPGK